MTGAEGFSTSPKRWGTWLVIRAQIRHPVNFTIDYESGLLLASCSIPSGESIQITEYTRNNLRAGMRNPAGIQYATNRLNTR
jgi:hypothetical protein